MEPVYPGEHSQKKVAMPSLHTPWWHGGGMQSLIFSSQRRPVKPREHIFVSIIARKKCITDAQMLNPDMLWYVSLFYLQHIHNHIHWVDQYTWLRLSRVCWNTHLCLSGMFLHWNLKTLHKTTLTIVMHKQSLFKRVLHHIHLELTEIHQENKYSFTNTNLLDTRRQSG